MKVALPVTPSHQRFQNAIDLPKKRVSVNVVAIDIMAPGPSGCRARHLGKRFYPSPVRSLEFSSINHLICNLECIIWGMWKHGWLLISVETNKFKLTICKKDYSMHMHM